MRMRQFLLHEISRKGFIPTVIVGFMLFPFLNGISHENSLQLNDLEYFEQRGFNVLVFSNQYTGMFFDEKTAGIELIHHGVRTATGGAVRLKPTPEQWDQIPKVIERNIDQEKNSIEVFLRYEDFDFDSKVKVVVKDKGILFSVHLEKPLPKELEGRAGFNLEFLPASYFEKTFLMDGKSDIFPLYPSGSMEVKSADTQIRQFAGHSTFDDRGRSEYVEPKPITMGKILVLAPEDPERHVVIQSLLGDLMLLDGRHVAQNGWYVVRSLIPADKSGKVLEWYLEANTIPNWKRVPMIAYSQVGYHPDQEKRAVIELDINDTPLKTASVFQITEEGKWMKRYTGDVKTWGHFLRYHYITFDFTSVEESGLYAIQYGNERTQPFQIGTHIYENVWHPTLDVWFPVQMDHMFVNEAYRVWHGAAHLDDALQAPVSHQHFDGYRSDSTTASPYKPGERIPGLNRGGWFDAGDYDIRTGAHCNTVFHLAESWEQFGIERDETLVDQKQRYVDIHHPDGIPDLLQQIEHGTLQLIAQYRAFGRVIPGIIVPELHQYHHLGDGSTMTDNLNYNPHLHEYESDGSTSGTFDDRWAFTNQFAWLNYRSISALAAASRALRGYNDTLADECLAAAKNVWNEEHKQSGMKGERGEVGAVLELLICTREEQYGERFEELLWPALEKFAGMNMSTAVRALPFMDKSYKNKLKAFVEKYKIEIDGLKDQNPFGLPMRVGGWAGNGWIIGWSVTNYLLHKAFPEIIGPEYTLRGLNYVYGCHPYSNISFVSGIGTQSKKVAYGSNRADYSFIAGGVVPGVMILKPDFPENKEDWPFLWGENEYVIDICASYIFLTNAVNELLNGTQ